MADKRRMEEEIRELEWDQTCFSRQEDRERDGGRTGETLILRQLRAERRRRCEELRAKCAEVEEKLESLLAPLREQNARERRLWVRRLRLAGSEDVEACLAHLDRITFELVHERIRGLQIKADARVEAAAEEAFQAMRKSIGLKEREPEVEDPWDWNRHRRRGGGGWNCA